MTGPPASLRRRLLRTLAALVAVWVGASGFILWRSWNEVREAYVDQIGHLANVIAGVLDEESLTPAEVIESTHRRRDQNYFVIVKSDGESVIRTANAPASLREEDDPWYIERASSADGRVEVIAGLEKEEVAQLVVSLALGAALPMLVALAIMTGLLGLTIARTLRPLDRLRAELEARSPDTLEPVAAADLPEELLPLAEALNMLLDRLGRAMEQERRFVSDASHELRTPLTAIRAQVETIDCSRLDAETRATLRQVLNAVGRSTRLVQQLLTLARADTDHRNPPVLLRLDDHVSAVAADLFPLAVKIGKELDLDCERALVRAEEADLEMLARNLIENAIHHSGDGRCINVRCTEEAGAAILTVEDAGPGIPGEDRPQMFDRFRRGTDSTADGAGLGLAIVASIAGRLRADVMLTQSERLGGLLVRVRFPPARGGDTSDSSA